MGQRHNWEFRIGISILVGAVGKKIAYHDKKYIDWSQRRDSALAKIKDKGLEVREHQMTGGSEFKVVADAELVKHLSTCEQKLKKHRLNLEDYTRWSRALAAETKTDRMFDLDISDIQYFGL